MPLHRTLLPLGRTPDSLEISVLEVKAKEGLLYLDPNLLFGTGQ